VHYGDPTTRGLRTAQCGSCTKNGNPRKDEANQIEYLKHTKPRIRPRITLTLFQRHRHEFCWIPGSFDESEPDFSFFREIQWNPIAMPWFHSCEDSAAKRLHRSLVATGLVHPVVVPPRILRQWEIVGDNGFMPVKPVYVTKDSGKFSSHLSSPESRQTPSFPNTDTKLPVLEPWRERSKVCPLVLFHVYPCLTTNDI